MKYEIIGELLPFAEASKMYRDSENISVVDGGWASIVRVGDRYYKVQQGLQEYEGRVYMQEVKIIE